MKVGRVLIVEDDADIRAIVAAVLELSGHQAIEASNGLEALEVVNREMPDLILLDMKMPVMNGWELVKQLDRRAAPRAPIVVMTAAEDARGRAAEIGAEGWIGKPFDLVDLIDVVERHLP